MELFYLDASAIVKTVRAKEEEGAVALRVFLQGADLVGSELLLTEVPRALQRVAAESPRFQLEQALQVAAEILDTLALRSVDDALLIGRECSASPTCAASMRSTW